MVGVSSPGIVDRDVDGDPVDGGVVVRIERGKSDNVEDNGDVGDATRGTLAESKGDGGDGSAVRTKIEARLSVKPSVQRRSRRYGASQGKNKARGKKKA